MTVLPSTSGASVAHPAFVEVRRLIEAGDERTIRDQIELSEIPAPPFGEERRGVRVAELFREIGLLDVATDGAGNVSGCLPGPRDGAPVVVSAHLDTIFPAGTDVRVREVDGKLAGPGIADDARGLAALLALARALVSAGVRPLSPVTFLATVGEEGAGDLRGVKHWFREGGPGRDARAFISLDGAGIDRIVSMGLGSRRLRAVARGGGGHSWTDWGVANPIHALGSAVAEIERLPLPQDPATTVTVARWGGGTSINAIPLEAWLELDIRSVSSRSLGAAEAQVRHILGASILSVNQRARLGGEKLTLEIQIIGDRPAGATSSDDPLVKAAVEATLSAGGTPRLIASSTDANIPMSLGIPAIAMGAGGESGRAHTPDEWFRNAKGPDGIVRALHTLLALAG